MERQEIVRFFRIMFQGIAIASLGTMGMNPTWGAFVVGLVTMFIALGLATFEKRG